MAIIVPSIVAEMIGLALPGVKDGQIKDSVMGAGDAAQVGTILALLDAIPRHLYPTDQKDLLLFEAIRGTLRGALENWRGASAGDATSKLRSDKMFGGQHPIVALYHLLRRCPDEMPPPDIAGLDFIEDAPARRVLRADVATAVSAFHNAEFKAATVLAGSVSEALLLWAIQRHDRTMVRSALSNFRSVNEGRPRDDDPETWDIRAYAEIARQCKIIDGRIFSAVHLCADYRNLIHPGLAQRLGLVCSSATAHLALGAMEAIIEHLSRGRI